MNWNELQTPAAVVDLDRVESNTRKMAERMTSLGVRLRPHVKTHKCLEAARLQVRGHFGGITVSTLAEARFFADGGFRDITYAVPIAPARLDEAASLARRGDVDALNLLVDHPQTLRAIADYARAQASAAPFRVFLKVDCGYHRAGVDPARDESVAFARELAASEAVDFKGVLTHAGHSYHCASPDEVRPVAEEERRVLADFAEKLRAAGAPPPVVSVGSTPTMVHATSLEGVDEARPGNYVFFDRFQAAIGSCSLDDAAFSVLVTVLGHYPERNELLVDAGALAFSKDEGPTHLDAQCGFGAVSSGDGRTTHPELRVYSISQEHGKIRSDTPIDYERLAVGTKLRIVPNHSCLSSALFDRYAVVRDDAVVDEWRPVRGW